ncbi:DsbA family protein [Actinoplanes sp. KI2]|uniref:DsbA family protein n=1 Tax=Actinoplanes sp. KI2 TaxID=2983315 RepID=UPI0021D57365|nr:DsbA family protein [Actinoplanes sp. KI2]MCU7725509.1 DsbA family protein [Actinoplanes sp. KI2]
MGKQVREQSREMRKGRAAVAAESGRKAGWPLIVGATIILVLLVAITIMIVKATKTHSVARPAASGAVVPPQGADGGALVTGQASAPVKLEVYADYMCPYCGRFERANGAEIARLIGDGTTRQYLHPLNFLDAQSNGTRYSSRAANAAATVYDKAPDKLLAFNSALFANQPAEGSDGLSDDKIAQLAGQAGVPQPVIDTFTKGTFEPWVGTWTEAAFAAGLQGTPTVKINGQLFQGDLYTAGPLTQAITAAAK